MENNLSPLPCLSDTLFPLFQQICMIDEGQSLTQLYKILGEYPYTEMTFWKQLRRLAQYHGTVAQFYHTVKRLASAVPQETTLSVHEREIANHICQQIETLGIYNMIREDYLQASRKNMLLASTLIMLNKYAQTLHIEILAIKGPVLAQIAYGDLTLRRYSDIDILVRKKDVKPLASALVSKSYVPYFPIERYGYSRVLFDLNNDLPFYDPARGISIEIHWDFFKKLHLPTQAFHPWDEPETVMINHIPVTTLKHETHLLYHVLHGSKHLWERFIWVVDVDRFIRNNPQLNWDEIVEKASSMGALRMFLLGPALAQRYLHTPLPSRITALLEEHNLNSLTDFIDIELNRPVPQPIHSLTKLRKILSMRDSFYHRALTLFEFIFKPGINERRLVVLPERFFWLYWIIRPFAAFWRVVRCRLFGKCTEKGEMPVHQ